jgi:hypothetical protein
MLNQEEIKSALIKWMQDFVEVPNAKLGNWAPCPYARAARINNKIDVCFSSVPNLFFTIKEKLPALESMDVVVICFDHEFITPEVLQEWVAETNKYLMPKDFVILEDHPDSPEYVNGVRMNFGSCGLLVLQKLSKLNEAADKLNQQGYYNHWKNDELNSVVTWRNQ